MKTFNRMAAQGDLLIIKIDSIPASARIVDPVEGQLIVAHSETGHNHVIEATPEVELYTTGDPMTLYLSVLKTEAILEHLRPFDTHESIAIPAGDYMLRRQREYTPEGWRRLED